MNVRIINKELIRDEFSRLVKITRPIVQIKKSWSMGNCEGVL